MNIDEAIKKASNKPAYKEVKMKKKYSGMSGVHPSSNGIRTDDPRGAVILFTLFGLAFIIMLIVIPFLV